MGNERDYDGEYEKDRHRQPENEVSWDSLAKEDKVYEFTKLTPTPPGYYQKRQVTQNSLDIMEGYGKSAYLPQFDSLEKPTQSLKQDNKQGNKPGERQKPEQTNKPNWFQRLFGGNRDNQQPNQKQPENNESGNVTGRTPRSRKPKKDTPTVANFKQQVKNRANAKLDENSQQVDRLSQAYLTGQQSKPLLQELRGVVKKDAQLEARQQELERNINLHQRPDIGASMGGVVPKGYSAAEREAYRAELAQIKQVRAALLAQYPASGMVKTQEADLSDAELQEVLSKRFDGVRQAISSSREKINTEDIPIEQLELVIQEVLGQQGEDLSPQQRQEIESYLSRQRNIDKAIKYGGTAAEIALTAGAVISSIYSFGITGLLAGFGTAIGVGTAAYELEQASDLNTIAKAAAGGEPLIANPDAAKFNRNLAIANLVLAGIDVGVGVTDGVKAARATNKVLSNGGADVIAKLTPEQTRKFNALVTAPNDVQAQKLYQSLQQELGDDFDNTYNLFKNLRADLFGQSELTNSITNLGDDFVSHNSSVMGDFSPTPNPTRSNHTIFSGVYDPETKTFITKPSGNTKLANGDVPEDLVPPRGGHGRVQRVLSQVNPGTDTSKTIGYTIYYKTSGELDVAFFSRGVNFRNYRNLRGLAPENLQQEFVKILEETTGLKVNIVPRPDLPD